MGLPSYPLRAQIIQHDPENDGMWVMIPSGVIPLLVRRLYPHADGMRISKKPMPVRGSWGYVQFPGGDIRNGIWMGTYHPNLVDSLPDDGSDPFSDYESHFNGSWNYTHGSSGFWGQQWSDNSSFVMGTTGLNLPSVFRHIVTSGQQRQRIPYLQSDRNPKPQPPFGWAYTQATSGGNGGFFASADASGNFTVTSLVSGRTLAIKNWNGASVTIDPSGNVSAVSPANASVTATTQILLSAPTIILSGLIKLGSANASTPVAFRGTVDSANDTLTSNFATKVVAE